MESGGKSRWMTKRTTTQLWKYCRFGLIRPSIRIYFSIWTSRLFEALRCSRACEIPWDRVQPCVGKKMSYFRPCLPQNRWRYWNVIWITSTFSLKSKIQILNHWVLAVMNRFYNSCQNPSLSNSATWEVHGLSVYQPYYHHSVKKSVISWGGSWSGVGALMQPSLSPYLIPSCQLKLNTLYVSPEW